MELAMKWQEALDLKHYAVNELQKRFVICTRHFPAKAYRNEKSNGLNSNALPNLNENYDNERIYYLSKKEQTETSAEARNQPISFKTEVKNPPESDFEMINRPAKKFKPFVFEVDHVLVGADQDVEEPETFELHEYSQEDPEAQVESLHSPAHFTANVETQTDPESQDIPQTFEEPKRITTEASTMTTDHPFYEIALSDTASQTDFEPVIPQAPNESPSCSKDDKLLSILYPEFKDRTKIQLVEMINEKNQRIESLEEKVKKLEFAMRDLL